MKPGDVLDHIFFGQDSRRIGELLPQEPFVSAIITSPPYYDLKDYGSKGQIGYGTKNIETYFQDLEMVFDGCRKVLKDDGTLWLVMDSIKMKGKMLPLPFMLAERLDKKGWTLQDVVVWRKDKTLPFSFPGRFRNLFEYVLVFSKTKTFKFRVHRVFERHKNEKRLREVNGNGGEARFLRGWPERYSALGANPGNVWDIPIPVQGTWDTKGDKTWLHQCPFPQQLVERIINISTDPEEVVLDPFSGSGSVAAQAEVMGRRFVGIELNEDFEEAYEIVRQRYRSDWVEQLETRKAVHQDRIEEGNLILRLRQLKHASVWGKLVQQSLQESGKSRGGKVRLLQVITICREDRTKLLEEGLKRNEARVLLSVPVDSYFVFDRVPNRGKLEELVNKQAVGINQKKHGLNKYGLKVSLKVLGLDELSPEALSLRHQDLLAVYSGTRFFQRANTLRANDVHKRAVGVSTGSSGFQIISDAHVKMDQKENVIEGALKTFLHKLVKESVSRIGSAADAAEYLGVTNGELKRILAGGASPN